MNKLYTYDKCIKIISTQILLWTESYNKMIYLTFHVNILQQDSTSSYVVDTMTFIFVVWYYFCRYKYQLYVRYLLGTCEYVIFRNHILLAFIFFRFFKYYQ